MNIDFIKNYINETKSDPVLLFSRVLSLIFILLIIHAVVMGFLGHPYPYIGF